MSGTTPSEQSGQVSGQGNPSENSEMSDSVTQPVSDTPDTTSADLAAEPALSRAAQPAVGDPESVDPGDAGLGSAAAAIDLDAAASGAGTTADVADSPTEPPPGSDEVPVIVPAASVHVAVDRPVQTVGRRKEAVVRVRLMPGTGQFTLNGRTLDGYFPNKVHQQLIKEPFVNLDKDGIYDVFASLSGGGVTGQAGALRLGIARALIELEPTDRPPLKKSGFLKRDPRVKERKKYGLKKARKAPQYSKR
jgi:small subunit ribosomal protein S9